MKKLFLIVLAGCMTLVGCVEHLEDYSVTSQKKITFQTAKYQTTRAVEEQINGSKFTYDHFVTHAWSAAVVNADKVFMNHQKVTKNDNANTWMPTVDYYWPNYSTVDFISYYPEQAETGEEKSCPKVESEKLTYTGYDVSGEKAALNTPANDLMYAEKAVGYSGNIDRVNDDNGGTNDSGYSGVPTLFHHALAQLEIRVLVKHPEGETESHWEAVIDHAKLDGYYTQGDLELELNDPSLMHGVTGWTPKGAENVGWTLSDDVAATSLQLVGTGSENETLTVSSTGSGEGYVEGETRGGSKSLLNVFVLPQTLTDKHFFDLKFTLNKYRGTTLETSEADTEVRHIQLKTDIIPYWGMNQRILYTIIINPAKNGKVMFDPAVVDWEDVTGNKDADDVYTPPTYFKIPDKKQWELSNVWHAYDAKGNNIAEVARELVGDPAANKLLYRSVVAYPSANEYANLSKGLIAQVTEMTDGSKTEINSITNMAGGTINWTPRKEVTCNNHVTSLTWGTEADYSYVLVASDGTLSLIREIPEDAKEATVEPYTVTDIDGNVYPVVKIAASYWLRENLRVTRYNDGTPLTQRRTITDLSTIANPNELVAGQVYMPETVPTYDWYSNDAFDAATASDEVKKRYGLNYNLCAVAGSLNPQVTVVPGDGNPWACIMQQGDPTLSTPTTNKQLAPKGWHIATMSAAPMFSQGVPSAFRNKLGDMCYLDEYIRYKWRHMMSKSEGRDYDKASWQVNAGYPLTNLSGFSLNAVPALGQKDGFVPNNTLVKFNNTGELQSAVLFMHESLKLAPNNVYFWNFPNIIGPDYEMYGQDWQLGSKFDFSSLTTNQEKVIGTSNLSLPVRCVRN